MDNYVEPQKLKEVYVTIMDVRDCIVLCYAMERIPNTFLIICTPYLFVHPTSPEKKANFRTLDYSYM